MRNHPLADGNKRAGFLVMVEFIERNGHHFEYPAGGVDEIADVIEDLAAGILAESAFIDWLETLIT